VREEKVGRGFCTEKHGIRFRKRVYEFRKARKAGYFPGGRSGNKLIVAIILKHYITYPPTKHIADCSVFKQII
jgi:hypothetical protein